MFCSSSLNGVCVCASVPCTSVILSGSQRTNRNRKWLSLFAAKRVCATTNADCKCNPNEHDSFSLLFRDLCSTVDICSSWLLGWVEKCTLLNYGHPKESLPNEPRNPAICSARPHSPNENHFSNDFPECVGCRSNDMNALGTWNGHKHFSTECQGFRYQTANVIANTNTTIVDTPTKRKSRYPIYRFIALVSR